MPKVKLFDEDLALANAKEVFWKKGYNAASMQDLVDAMQISRQSLYDTYGNKEDLFVKCLQSYQQKASNLTCDFLSYNGNVKASLQHYFYFLIDDIVADKQQKGCFMLNTLVELVPENKLAKKVVSKNFDDLEANFTKLFTAAKLQGDLETSFGIEELTTHFITAMHGIRLMGKVKKDKAQLTKLFDMAMLVFD
jgi:TetR/AcrR family transcriptional regulator, transcriptional repressor for nem operon